MKKIFFPNGSQTTDGRYVKIGDDGDEWWDTTGIDIVHGDAVIDHMMTNMVGIVVDRRPTKLTPH
jgi:hypothetical protein